MVSPSFRTLLEEAAAKMLNFIWVCLRTVSDSDAVHLYHVHTNPVIYDLFTTLKRVRREG